MEMKRRGGRRRDVQFRFHSSDCSPIGAIHSFIHSFVRSFAFIHFLLACLLWLWRPINSDCLRMYVCHLLGFFYTVLFGSVRFGSVLFCSVVHPCLLSLSWTRNKYHLTNSAQLDSKSITSASDGDDEYLAQDMCSRAQSIWPNWRPMWQPIWQWANKLRLLLFCIVDCNVEPVRIHTIHTGWAWHWSNGAIIRSAVAVASVH